MVRELRDKTDAPMMECKKALTEANGDLAKAEEMLRIKLGNKASKAASRVAAEGVVAAYIAPTARRARWSKSTAKPISSPRTTTSSLSRQRCRSSSPNGQSGRRRGVVGAAAATARQSKQCGTALVGKIGENIRVRRFARIAATGKLASVPARRRASACWSNVTGGDEQVGKDIAMHIAAMQAGGRCRKRQIPAELIEQESATIAARKAAESGKPADIVAKMVEGTRRRSS